MVCVSCKTKKHELCPGGTWCDCQCWAPIPSQTASWPINKSVKSESIEVPPCCSSVNIPR